MAYATNVKIGDCNTINEVMEKAEANFIPQKLELITANGIDIPDHAAIVRSDNNFVLGVMGKDYTPFAPVQTFAIADVLRERHGLKYTNAYTVDGGRKIVVEMKTIDDTLRFGRNDEGGLRIRIKDSFDGSCRFTASVGVWRQVCSNGMFGWADEMSVSVRHTKNAQARLEAANQIWAKAEMDFTDIVAKTNQLISKQVTEDEVDKFLDALLGEITEKSSTRIKNQRNDIKYLFEHGHGNNGKTAWDLVNGATEYYQHETNSNNPDARLASYLTGSGSKKSKKAIEIALSL